MGLLVGVDLANDWMFLWWMPPPLWAISSAENRPITLHTQALDRANPYLKSAPILSPRHKQQRNFVL